VRRTGSATQVFVEGAWWTARAPGADLDDGATVEIVGVDGLTLVVEPSPRTTAGTETPRTDEQ
jgi:membrane protein implicated in regulation of membrane protease activity